MQKRRPLPMPDSVKLAVESVRQAEVDVDALARGAGGDEIAWAESLTEANVDWAQYRTGQMLLKRRGLAALASASEKAEG